MGAMAGISIAQQAKGELVGGLDAAQQAQLQGQTAQENQQIADRGAADARVRGARQAALIRMQASQLGARQRLEYANSGIDVTRGTPVQTAANTAAAGELDAQAAMNNAAREAWGYEVTANRYGQQAKLADQARRRAFLGTVAGTGGDVAGAVMNANDNNSLGGIKF